MDGYGKRVLIIDDNEDIRHLTGIALMNREYNVYTASDGFEGAEEMKKRRYDVVLVDYHMPRRNGLQFIEMCRVLWPDTPIILMSAEAWLTDHSHPLPPLRGTFGCIAKPFDLKHLIELVHQACHNVPQREPPTLLYGDRATAPQSSPLTERDTSRHAMKAIPLTN